MSLRLLSFLLRRGFAGHAVFCLFALAGALRADTAVFADGKALLPVYVGARASADERAAAEELARVLGAMSGLSWRVQTEPADGSAGFYVGRTRASEKRLHAPVPSRDLLAPHAGEIGPDGFRIRSVEGKVFVEGATPEATAYAVSWLLQREGGVRWYAPGPVGEVIPRRKAWTLPDLAVVREPAYVSREISGVDPEWARRNGLRGRFEYSHNLTNLFTPEVYDAHPEWFGAVDGVRRRPLGGGDYHWQPELARQDVAAYAAARAAEAFARDGRRASFSLGMNDTVRFDQGEATRALVEPLRYFRGMPDYSPLVFTFMNRAAAELERRQVGDGRYLGCLAYFWCENAPPFPVDPCVVPYVTTDRTQFFDPDYRAVDLALMERWRGSGVRGYGLWEYGYGSGFVVPRVPHAMLAEAVREGWRRGARGYMADAVPHTGFDSYKVWLLAQLLQEPERSTEELETDFFNGWYGPAAEPMRRFFARCEAQWLAQPGPPWWIKFFQQQDQVALFPPEVCRELRGILDEAARAAEDGGGRRTACPAKPWRSREDGVLCEASAKQGGRRTEDGRRRTDDGEQRTEDGVWTGGATEGNEEKEERRTEDGRRRTEGGVPCEASAQQGGRRALRSLGEAGRAEGDRWEVGTRAEEESERCESGKVWRTQVAAAVALTSRAFAVTEAAVEFAARRHELETVEAETLSPTELGARLIALRRAQAALVRAATAATAGDQPALAAVNLGYLLRNDPVPRLLAALGRADRVAPLAALTEMTLADEPAPPHWAALAVACAKGRLPLATNLVANGTFRVVAREGQQPKFMFPRSGELPADWEVRAAPTEFGRVALGPVTAGGRALRIEGAWDTEVLQALPAEAGKVYVAEVRMRGQSSPGNDAALTLAFLDAGGRLVGEYRATMLPKGETAWRTLALADTAPPAAKYVVVGLSATRQFGGDWLEATGVTLRASE